MKILHIVSSPLGENSNSIKLAGAIIEKLLLRYPGSELIERDLTAGAWPHLNGQHLHAFFTPGEQRSPAQIAAIQTADQAISELKEAGILVIGVPMYNFNIPSTLKTWIDYITRPGETFSYSEKGAEGLIKNKKVYLAIATGAVYSDGAMKDFDFIEPYLRHMLSFLGMTDITTWRVEGVNIPALKPQAMEKAVAAIEL